MFYWIATQVLVVVPGARGLCDGGGGGGADGGGGAAPQEARLRERSLGRGTQMFRVQNTFWFKFIAER